MKVLLKFQINTDRLPANMKNTILYISTVLIWGTTWYAIKLQLGHAPIEISIFYRAFFAAILLIIFCRIRRYSLKFSLINHFYLCLLGLSMFSIHYIFIYDSTHYIYSGIVAVVCSCNSFLNIMHNYIFFKVKPRLNVIFGALIGIIGLGIFFWHEFFDIELSDTVLKGLILSIIGTIIFSFGGAITKRNNHHAIPILPAIAISTANGSIIMFIYTLIQGHEFVLPSSLSYWGSLVYLIIFGSIIAFACYMQLIKNIGPELAGYASVLFPIVALFFSSFFEGYHWSYADLIGLSFVIFGNILIIKKKKAPFTPQVNG